MIVLVYNADFSKEEPTRIMIDYFSPLSEVLDRFNNETEYGLDKFYNQYGQELPLTYRVQKSGLAVYYRLTRSQILESSSDEEAD